MRPSRERIEALELKKLRESHVEGAGWFGERGKEFKRCYECDLPVPCLTSRLVATVDSLALEADTLREALERLLAATHHAFHAPVAGTGDAEAMVAAYENARAALGGTER